MGLFDWLFGRKKDNVRQDVEIPILAEVKLDENLWEDVPAYVDADSKEHELVSVIASSIAAGDHPDSEFRIKNIQMRNPEAERVAVIASAMAAGTEKDSQFVVRRIKKRKETT